MAFQMLLNMANQENSDDVISCVLQGVKHVIEKGTTYKLFTKLGVSFNENFGILKLTQTRP